MQTKNKFFFLAVLVVVSISCKAVATMPPSTLPMVTSSPICTSMPEPDIPPAPSIEPPSISAQPVPSGPPEKSWKDIPILPGADSGQDDSSSYTFTVKAALEDVQKFYEQELENQGWSMLASDQAPTGGLMMIFTKGSDTVTVIVMDQSDGFMHVMLVK